MAKCEFCNVEYKNLGAHQRFCKSKVIALSHPKEIDILEKEAPPIPDVVVEAKKSDLPSMAITPAKNLDISSFDEFWAKIKDGDQRKIINEHKSRVFNGEPIQEVTWQLAQKMKDGDDKAFIYSYLPKDYVDLKAKNG